MIQYRATVITADDRKSWFVDWCHFQIFFDIEYLVNSTR